MAKGKVKRWVVRSWTTGDYLLYVRQTPPRPSTFHTWPVTKRSGYVGRMDALEFERFFARSVHLNQCASPMEIKFEVTR